MRLSSHFHNGNIGWNSGNLGYYCVKQHDITDRGAACLATIYKQNGYKIGVTQIREYAGTDREGTNAYGVINAAEKLGIEAKGVKGRSLCSVTFYGYGFGCIVGDSKSTYAIPLKTKI